VSQGAARWELERNGGSVERAVERALREGGLPEVRPSSSASSHWRVRVSLTPTLVALQPPASYFPPPSDGSVPAVARPATPTPVTPARGASTSAHVAQGPPPSLIKRMGLQAKVAADDHEQGTGAGKGKEADGSPLKGAGWSPDASQREQNLRARKEKLVLEARRCVLLSSPSSSTVESCSALRSPVAATVQLKRSLFSLFAGNFSRSSSARRRRARRPRPPRRPPERRPSRSVYLTRNQHLFSPFLLVSCLRMCELESCSAERAGRERERESFPGGGGPCGLRLGRGGDCPAECAC